MEMTDAQPVPRSELYILLTLAAVQFTNIMDFMIMMPLGPQLRDIFHITPAQFGLLVSAYTLTAGTVGFFSSFVIDRFDRKRSLTWAYLGFTIGTFMCAFAPNYHLLLLARAGTGVFGGLIGGLTFSITGDLIPFARRGRAMGIVMTSFSAASVFGVPFGLFIASKYDWHAPFVFLGVFGLVLQLLIYKVIPPVGAHLASSREQKPFELLQSILKNRSQRFALFLTSMLMLGQFTIIPFLADYMVRNVGFKNSQLPYIYFFGGLATIFSSPIIGKLADRYGAANVFFIAAVLALIPIWIITHLSPTPVWIVLIVTTLFFVIGGGRMVPAMALVTSAVEPRFRGGFMSLNGSLQQLFSGVAAFVGGLIVYEADGKLVNYNYVCYLTIFATLMCLWISRQIRPAS
jgi:MFS transporter, DHA1 family, inner membrane transport protein